MLTSLVYLQRGNVKKFEKFLKMVNIDKQNLHVFRTTSEISMKFSGNMCLMIILKVTKNQVFTSSQEKTVLEKPRGGSN